MGGRLQRSWQTRRTVKTEKRIVFGMVYGDDQSKIVREVD